MKVGIRITAGMAKALSSEQMGPNSTKAISKIIKEMEKALNIKPMELLSVRGSGNRINSLNDPSNKKK